MALKVRLRILYKVGAFYRVEQCYIFLGEAKWFIIGD